MKNLLLCADIKTVVLYIFFCIAPDATGAVSPTAWFDGASVQPLSTEQRQAKVDGLILQIDQGFQAQVENYLHKEKITYRRLALSGFYYLPKPEDNSVWNLSLRLQDMPGVKLIEPNWLAPVAPR